jgi:hypothetical protein
MESLLGTSRICEYRDGDVRFSFRCTPMRKIVQGSKDCYKIGLLQTHAEVCYGFSFTLEALLM